jgi:hypothetical protein
MSFFIVRIFSIWYNGKKKNVLSAAVSFPTGFFFGKAAS